MPTVDDLVISLTIKETGKLGKLQKQLEAIVGKKGEKIPTFGMDTETKGMLSFIKRRIMFIAPIHIPGETKPYAMSEAARIKSFNLDADIRTYAEKLIPQRQDIYKATLKEFNVKTRDDLIDVMEDKIRDWQLRLEDIQRRNWTNDAAQRFLARITGLVSRRDLPVGVGWSKKLMTDIDQAVGERNTEIAELLKKLGFEAKSQPWLARVKQEKLETFFGSENRDLIIENRDLLLKALGVEKQELKNKITELALKAEKWEGGTIGALEKLSKEFNIPLMKLYTITEKEIAKSEELRAIQALLLIVMNMSRKTGAPAGISLGFQKGMIEALKKVSMGDISQFPPKIQEQIQEQINKKFGKKIKNIFERYKLDFLITNVQNSLDKIEILFGEEIAESLKDVDSFFTEQKKILSETNRGQFRDYKDLVGSLRLIGLATQVLVSFTDDFPDILTKRMDIATESLKAGIIQKLTDLEKEILTKEFEKKTLEKELESFQGTLEEQKAFVEKASVGFLEINKALDKLNEQIVKLKEQKEITEQKESPLLMTAEEVRDLNKRLSEIYPPDEMLKIEELEELGKVGESKDDKILNYLKHVGTVIALGKKEEGKRQKEYLSIANRILDILERSGFDVSDVRKKAEPKNW